MVLNKYVLKSEEFQSYAMVLLLAITAPNSAMLYSHFLLCRLCLSPGTAKTLLWSRPKNPSSGRKPLLFSLLFLPSSLIVMPRERWMKVDIFLHRSYFWGIGPSHYLVITFLWKHWLHPGVHLWILQHPLSWKSTPHGRLLHCRPGPVGWDAIKGLKGQLLSFCCFS